MSPAPVDPQPDFIPGQPARANEVDARFAALYTWAAAIDALVAAGGPDGAVTTAKLAALAVTPAKVEATIFTQYKTLHVGCGGIGPGQSAGVYIFVGTNYLFRIFAADLAVTGKTPMLRISAAEAVANVNPGVTTEVVLVPVTAGGGSTFGVVPTIGAVVGASANLGAPGANAAASAVSADFAVPADGIYTFAYRLSGGTTPNPVGAIFSAALQIHHT